MRAQLQTLPEAQQRFWLISTLRDLLAEVMEEPLINWIRTPTCFLISVWIR